MPNDCNSNCGDLYLQVEPTYAELSCIVDNLEELGDLPSLWKAVAEKFRRTNPSRPNDFEYWRRVINVYAFRI